MRHEEILAKHFKYEVHEMEIFSMISSLEGSFCNSIGMSRRDKAVEAIKKWYDDGLTYVVDWADPVDVANFVATHASACVWAVALRQGHERRKAQESG